MCTDAVTTPVPLFHWDVYSLDDSDREFPVFLEDINGFGENLFVQIETTAPPPRRRSKKRSQKDRRLSRQNDASDGYAFVSVPACTGARVYVHVCVVCVCVYLLGDQDEI